MAMCKEVEEYWKGNEKEVEVVEVVRATRNREETERDFKEREMKLR
jgi:hypothetical protein